jgi:predicted RNase H-like HicB family nuclease
LVARGKDRIIKFFKENNWLLIMNVSIEKQSDGTYIAYNTDDNTKVQLIGTGNSVKEAKQDFIESKKWMTEGYKEDGEQVPPELYEEVVFRFDLSSLFEYYNMLNVSALARYLGINPSLMRQYKKGDTYISDAQLAKIESGIKALGKDLAAISLV